MQMLSSSNVLCVGASICLQIRTLIKEDSVKNEEKIVIKKHVVSKYNIQAVPCLVHTDKPSQIVFFSWYWKN